MTHTQRKIDRERERESTKERELVTEVDGKRGGETLRETDEERGRRKERLGRLDFWIGVGMSSTENLQVHF